MRMSPASRWGSSSAMVWSATAAGTISHTAPRFCEFFHEIRKRSCSGRAFMRQFADRFWRDVEHHALVTFLQQPPRHVGAHSSQSYHSELHKFSCSKNCV